MYIYSMFMGRACYLGIRLRDECPASLVIPRVWVNFEGPVGGSAWTVGGIVAIWEDFLRSPLARRMNGPSSAGSWAIFSLDYLLKILLGAGFEATCDSGKQGFAPRKQSLASREHHFENAIR